MSSAHRSTNTDDERDTHRPAGGVEGRRPSVPRAPDQAGGVRFSLGCVECLAAALDRLGKGGMDVVLLAFELPDGRGFDTFA